MPPKVKVTKADLIQTAAQIIREEGEEALNARAVAARLKVSTQPVFSNYKTMQELRRDVTAYVQEQFEQCVQKSMEQAGRNMGKRKAEGEEKPREKKTGEKKTGEKNPGAPYPPYKASGMAYIRFAAEEKEWFKFLFMRNRDGENPGFQSETDQEILKLIQKNTGLSREEAELLHFEMWVCVHGLGVMAATSYFEPEEELVSRVLTDVYQGVKSQHCRKE